MSEPTKIYRSTYGFMVTTKAKEKQNGSLVDLDLDALDVHFGVWNDDGEFGGVINFFKRGRKRGYAQIHLPADVARQLVESFKGPQ